MKQNYFVRNSTLILVVLYTLVGAPTSVFSQEVTDVDAASVASSTEAVPTPATYTPPPYKVDKLPVDKVYSDFVVGPGRFALEVAPGESKVVMMTVTNRMGITKLFRLGTEDVAGSNDPEVSVELLGDEVGPYTLKDYISVPHTTFTLDHGERAYVPVTVSVPADAEPGGFYGSLLTSIVSENADSEVFGDAVPKSKLVSRIGTLFFVTTPGNIVRDSKVLDFSTINHKQVYTKGPVDFGLVIENTGSVHISPAGELSILNTLGTEVGYVELYPWNILPKSVRTKEIGWNRDFLAGRYTAVLRLDRGHGDGVEEFTYTFWVVPVKYVLIIFTALTLLILGIRFIATRFEFKRKS